MPNRTFIFGVTVIAIIIVIAGVGWTFFATQPQSASPPQNQDQQTNPDNTDEPTDQPSDNPTDNTNDTNPETVYASPEDVRDAAMTYIKTAHSNTAQFMDELFWNGGRLETEETDTETYIYYANDWTLTVNWPLVETPTYNISANYNSQDIFIVWEGTYQNGAVKEKSYTPPTRPQAPSQPIDTT